jgi:hypothetical protein
MNIHITRANKILWLNLIVKYSFVFSRFTRSEKVHPKKSYFSSTCEYVKLFFSLRVPKIVYYDKFIRKPLKHARRKCFKGPYKRVSYAIFYYTCTTI